MTAPLRSRVIALVCALGGAVPVLAQVPAPPGADRFVARLEPRLQRAVDDHAVPGLAIGVVEDGRVAYARGFGAARLGEPGSPVTTRTLFHIASVTKTFTATAVMQLVERGVVDLNAPVTRYVPYFSMDDGRYRQITVRHLLTHTSGMPLVTEFGWDRPQDDDGALERYVRGLSGQRLLFDPGAKFAYSNMGFDVLGDLIAKASGATYEDYVEKEVLGPAGMGSSTLMFERADPGRLASGYTRPGHEGEFTPIAHFPHNREHGPSGDMLSCVDDMVRWLLINLGHGELDGRRILRADTHQSMWTSAYREEGKRGEIGLCWIINNDHGERTISHDGGDDGFAARVVLWPARKLGVVVMINTDRAPFRTIWDDVLAAALGGADVGHGP